MPDDHEMVHMAHQILASDPELAAEHVRVMMRHGRLAADAIANAPTQDEVQDRCPMIASGLEHGCALVSRESCDIIACVAHEVGIMYFDQDVSSTSVIDARRVEFYIRGFHASSICRCLGNLLTIDENWYIYIAFASIGSSDFM